MATNHYNNKKSADEYIKIAEGFNGRKLIEKLKLFLSPNCTLLELGSGPGADWEILNKNYRVIGSDVSEAFLIHLKKNFIDGEFLNLDAITLQTEMTFNGIYSNKVLHHLTDGELIDSIKRQSEILNSGGIICHSFWKGEGDETFKGMFVNYHNAKDVEMLFSPCFELLVQDEYAEFETGDSLLFNCKKKVN